MGDQDQGTGQAANSQTGNQGNQQTGQQANTGAGQAGGQQGVQQNAQQQPNAGQQAGNQSQQQGQQQQPQPYATFPDAKTFETRMQREARKLMNQRAREAGYEDWDDMQAALPPDKGGGAGTQTAGGKQPGKDKGADGSIEADRLRMALTVGAKLNLPAALVSRLQGSTPEEMEADAQALLGLMTPQGGQGQQGGQRQPGIPLVQNNQNQPTTFTRAQLRDAEFVRKNADAIRQAHREGRIVNS